MTSQEPTLSSPYCHVRFTPAELGAVYEVVQKLIAGDYVWYKDQQRAVRTILATVKNLNKILYGKIIPAKYTLDSISVQYNLLFQSTQVNFVLVSIEALKDKQV
jgi:hypothetical protein